MADMHINGGQDGTNKLLATLNSRVTLTKEQTKLIQDLGSVVESSDSARQTTLLTDQLLLLPIDAPMLIAGYVYFAINNEELALEAVNDKAAQGLLETLVKLSRVDSAAVTSALLQVRSNRRQSDNVRRMLVAMIDDPRVVVLKLVERLVHLLPTKREDPAESLRIAREVLNFYAPLASRLGIWQLKWVLEDYSFRCLQPREYKHVAGQLQDRRSQREDLVEKIQSDLRWRLQEAGVNAEVRGRAKNIYGIYRKMREKDIEFTDVHDVLAIRVIVDSVSECYQVLGVVHTSWPHISNEFDDYIANPKTNGYRSLHTAVYGPRGHVLEVQIRTHEMHLESELGVCSHWSYKGEHHSSLEDGAIDWMREVLAWHEDLFSIDPVDPSEREIARPERLTYVSTPKRHIVDLPDGSTALDFAFKVHTDIGLHCTGARVDGEEVALNEVLRTGQTVEILTHPRATPQRIWLDADMKFYKTTKTRDILRSHFLSFDRNHNVSAGRDWVQQEIDRLGLHLTPEDAARALEFEKSDELFVDVALGSMKARQALLEIAKIQDEVSDALEVDGNEKKTMQIHIQAVDRKNLIRDITKEIATLNINIVNLKLGAPALNKDATVDIWVQVSNLGEASMIIVSLRRIHRVSDVRLMKPEQSTSS